MRKLLFVHAAALALTLAGPAIAADLPMKSEAPYVAPRFSWTGCYVGGHVGGGFARKDITDPVQLVQDHFGLRARRPASPPSGTSPTGAVIGGQIGCDYQFASCVVVGIEGAASGSTMKGSTIVGLPARQSGDIALVQANTDFLAERDRAGRLRLRQCAALRQRRRRPGRRQIQCQRQHSHGVCRSTFKGWTIATAGSWAAAWIGRSRVIGPSTSNTITTHSGTAAS